ncbi:hypothetical protein SynRCC2555_00415 [Synechococcus sp. WH 8101]|nr:hypothetical protein SynRCC2555_00415 [Synechococcus sp. WH 8101]
MSVTEDCALCAGVHELCCRSSSPHRCLSVVVWLPGGSPVMARLLASGHGPFHAVDT